MRPHGLGREERLRKRSDFERVYAVGAKVVTRPAVVFGAPNSAGERRIGVTATRKIGNAVIRNRARRLVREAYRTVRTDLPPGLDIVVVVRPPLLRLSPAELRPVLVDAIRRAAGSGE